MHYLLREFLVSLWVQEIVLNLSFEDAPTIHIFFEVVITIDQFETWPAEVFPALKASHFIAPLDFRNWCLTVRAFLGAIIDILKVQRLLDNFVAHFWAFDIILVYEFVNHIPGYLHVRTPFVNMVLALAFCAEDEWANCAMALVFILVDLGRVLALGAPPKVLHLVNCFRYWEFVQFCYHPII